AALLSGRGESPTPLSSSDLHRARWLRQLPECRSESHRLIEAILRANPDDPAGLLELGGWWLGEVDAPDARHHAVDAFRRAAMGPSGDPSAAVLLALMTSDPRPLDRQADGPRVRVARAILAERRARFWGVRSGGQQ